MHIPVTSKTILACFVALFLSQLAHAQKRGFNPGAGEEPKRSPVRKVLNMFSLNVASGYGLTMYTQRWEEYSAMVRDESLFLKNGNTYYDNWFNRPSVKEITASPNDLVVSSDTSDIKYRGIWGGIPFQLQLNFHYQRFRVGGGIEWELHKMGKLSPVNEKNVLPDYQVSPHNTVFTRYFGMIGYRAYDFIDYSFVPELRIGKMKMGNAFDKQLTSSSMHINLGVSIEKNFSEYFRVYVRPSLEYKNFTTTLPGSESAILNKQPAFYVHAGIAIHYPEVPRCPIASCRTQLKHIHGNKEYRGQPISRKQNPKIGENDPVPRKYRGANKRKRSPY